MKNKVHIYIVSAFSHNDQGGNKAGVLLDAHQLTPQQKMNIAKKLGYSETVFITNSDVADLKLEYFTPTEEVPLCGHATLAAFVTLQHLNLLKKMLYRIETKAGILTVQIGKDGLVMMQQTAPVYDRVLSTQQLEQCFPSVCFHPQLPIQIVSTGLRDIMLPVSGLEQLSALNPDFSRLASLSKEQGVIGAHAFALSSSDEVTAICRNFAPLYGIDEESATGTSNCALACYLFRYYKKQSQYIFEQGHQLGEVSRIIVKLQYHDDIIDKVFVGGYGCLSCEKNLFLE
ncbi:MAG: PhzF family phenazine biosynthesis protein [Bacilli bacterium]|nr:PhzF family phenazine biosynthesis protein [Bacilli bacterium]